jgi:hypothetical protein
MNSAVELPIRLDAKRQKKRKGPTMTDINSNWKRSARELAAAILFISLACLGLIAPADVSNKKTIVTFSAPVEVRGKALPAGTYVFKLLDSASNRNIVQIFDKDEKQLLATIPAVPDYRLTPPEKPIIQFEERPSGTPEAIKAWFYPGDTYGVQFVYPHERAVELAKRTNQNVLSMRDEMKSNMAAGAKSAKDPSVQEMETTEVTGVKPSGEPVAVIVIVGTKPQK